MTETETMEAAEITDDVRLRFCRASRHSYFGPICMTCGHDMMKRLNGEPCSCEVCSPALRASATA